MTNLLPTIYPTPQHVTTFEKAFNFPKQVKGIAFTGGEKLLPVLSDILAKHEVMVETATAPAADRFNVILTTDSKNLPEAFQEVALSDEAGFSPYTLALKEEGLVILAKEETGLFYGLQTLRQLLKTGLEVSEVVIQDYANTKVRGFIEGYYGIPWSNENRKSLMKFGGALKANAYIFAPKDDPYHREKWQELYPAEKLAELKELATVGNETGCLFVWTISPLGEVAKMAQKGEDVLGKLDKNADIMLKKFQQLYDVGVRQFGVLGDDVGALPHSYVVALMKKAHDWVVEKGDVSPLLYCPSSYNSAWAWNKEELNAYEAGFAKDIEIFWTGSMTCGPVVESTLETFKNKENEGVVRRDPLFWLNWPVNDVDMTQVFLGKAEMLELGVKHLAGVVTNPMQEAQASKLAIFAICDYAWNTHAFDLEKNWQDSFTHVEKTTPKALKTLAQHMTNTGKDGIMDLQESWELRNYLWETLFNISQNKALSTELVKNQFEKIVTASDEFLTQSKNAGLVEELTPFVLALKELAESNLHYLASYEAFLQGQKEKAVEEFQAGKNLRKQSLRHERPMLASHKEKVFARPAKRYLQPYTDEVEILLAEKLN